jgi:hypothetical protein
MERMLLTALMLCASGLAARAHSRELQPPDTPAQIECDQSGGEFWRGEGAKVYCKIEAVTFVGREHPPEADRAHDAVSVSTGEGRRATSGAAQAPDPRPPGR